MFTCDCSRDRSDVLPSLIDEISLLKHKPPEKPASQPNLVLREDGRCVPATLLAGEFYRFKPKDSLRLAAPILPEDTLVRSADDRIKVKLAALDSLPEDGAGPVDTAPAKIQDPRVAVASAWREAHASLSDSEARIDRAVTRPFVHCVQSPFHIMLTLSHQQTFVKYHMARVESNAPKKAEYEQYLHTLFDAAAALMLPKEKTDLGKHCFGYATLLAGEFYCENPKDSLRLVAPGLTRPPPSSLLPCHHDALHTCTTTHPHHPHKAYHSPQLRHERQITSQVTKCPSLPSSQAMK